MASRHLSRVEVQRIHLVEGDPPPLAELLREDQLQPWVPLEHSAVDEVVKGLAGGRTVRLDCMDEETSILESHRRSHRLGMRGEGHFESFTCRPEGLPVGVVVLEDAVLDPGEVDTAQALLAPTRAP